MIPSPVSAARRMSCEAFFALAGAAASKVYAKMLVSRRNLPLIHFFPRIGAGGAHVSQTAHQRIHGGATTRLRCVLLQPLAEGRVQRRVPRLRNQPRLLNQALFRTESDVLHTAVVYTISVRFQRCESLIGWEDRKSV